MTGAPAPLACATNPAGRAEDASARWASWRWGTSTHRVDRPSRSTMPPPAVTGLAPAAEERWRSIGLENGLSRRADSIQRALIGTGPSSDRTLSMAPV